MQNDDPSLSVAGLISALRAELEKADANRRAAQRKPILHVSSAEIELKFTVGNEGGGKGGLDLKVVSIGGDARVRSEEVHTIRLKLEVPSDVDYDEEPRFHDKTKHGPKRKGVRPLE